MYRPASTWSESKILFRPARDPSRLNRLEKCGLWWAPPDSLRAPPMHLNRFYGLVAQDKGMYTADRDNATYCKQIPNSDKFVYLRQRDFDPQNMRHAPFFHLTNLADDTPLSAKLLQFDEEFGKGLLYCRVGNQKCVLKITKGRGCSYECFAGLIASMYCVGPSVLDFWSVLGADGEYRVYHLMECVDIAWRTYYGMLKNTGNASKRLRELLVEMIDYVQLNNTDWDPSNIMVYNNERLCLIDWERTTVFPGPKGVEPVVDDEYKEATDDAKRDMHGNYPREPMPMRRQPYRVIDATNKTSKPIDNPKDYGLMDAEMLE